MLAGLGACFWLSWHFCGFRGVSRNSGKDDPEKFTISSRLLWCWIDIQSDNPDDYWSQHRVWRISHVWPYLDLLWRLDYHQPRWSTKLDNGRKWDERCILQETWRTTVVQRWLICSLFHQLNWLRVNTRPEHWCGCLCQYDFKCCLPDIRIGHAKHDCKKDN